MSELSNMLKNAGFFVSAKKVNQLEQELHQARVDLEALAAYRSRHTAPKEKL